MGLIFVIIYLSHAVCQWSLYRCHIYHTQSSKWSKNMPRPFIGTMAKNYYVQSSKWREKRPDSRSLVIRWDLEGQRQMINHWSLLSVAPPLETPWRRPSKPHGAAPRNPCAAPRNPMAPCLETPGAPRLKTPGDKFWDQNFQVSVVFRPLRPKRAIPHPITIQNMRFRR